MYWKVNFSTCWAAKFYISGATILDDKEYEKFLSDIIYLKDVIQTRQLNEYDSFKYYFGTNEWINISKKFFDVAYRVTPINDREGEIVKRIFPYDIGMFISPASIREQVEDEIADRETCNE